MLQVFTNLLENVVKHTPSGTRATIEAVLEDRLVRVSIEDTGPGLPPGNLEQLFAKFHRGRDESSAGGAGLGLSICRAIVTAHGGQIDATQRPGGGARFFIHFAPVLELPGQSAEEPAPRPVLRRKDADAGAAANLIDLVGDVDDIEAHRQRTGALPISKA